MVHLKPGTSSGSCLNCNAAVSGKFCSECGQSTKSPRISFKVLAADFVGASLSLDSKLIRSLKPLVLQPGFLTNAFMAGKRVTFLSPLRLYLVCSLLFFVMAAVNSNHTTNPNGLVMMESGEDRVLSWGKLPEESAEMSEEEVVKNRIENNRRVLDSYIQEVAGENPESIPTVDSSGNPVDVPSEAEGISEDNSEPLTEAEADGDGRRVSRADAFVESQLEAFTALGPKGMRDAVRNGVSKSFFILMPLFALMLEGLYYRRDPLYVDHLIFALHLHAFGFAVMAGIVTLDLVIPADLTWMLALFLLFGAPIYLYCAMRTVYEQSRLKTLAKLAILYLGYQFMVVLGLLVSMTTVFLTA